jgi:hypothetical protein
VEVEALRWSDNPSEFFRLSEKKFEKVCNIKEKKDFKVDSKYLRMMFCHIIRSAQIEDAEEINWTCEGGSNMRLEKTA